MNEKEEYLLKNYQNLMEPYEQLTARWLTEEWDGIEQEIPKWLKNRVWRYFTMKHFGKPSAMARVICLKLLEKRKDKISLSKNEI